VTERRDVYRGVVRDVNVRAGEFSNPRLVLCSSLHVLVAIRIGDDPGNRSGRHHAGPRRMVSYRIAPLAVFCCSSGKLSAIEISSTAESWAADGSANDRTAASLAVLSLFWFETATMGRGQPYRRNRFTNPRVKEFYRRDDIITVAYCQFHKCYFCEPQTAAAALVTPRIMG
jgi:hypothetical protein